MINITSEEVLLQGTVKEIEDDLATAAVDLIKAIADEEKMEKNNVFIHVMADVTNQVIKRLNNKESK